jgi:hypothetical protein
MKMKSTIRRHDWFLALHQTVPPTTRSGVSQPPSTPGRQPTVPPYRTGGLGSRRTIRASRGACLDTARHGVILLDKQHRQIILIPSARRHTGRRRRRPLEPVSGGGGDEIRLARPGVMAAQSTEAAESTTTMILAVYCYLVHRRAEDADVPRMSRDRLTGSRTDRQTSCLQFDLLTEESERMK